MKPPNVLALEVKLGATLVQCPNFPTIGRIANALGVSPLMLFAAGASEDERAAVVRRYDSDGRERR